MNRMGWAIAAGGAWMLAALVLAGATGGRPAAPDCTAGYYSSGGWCVHFPQPAAPLTPATHILVSAWRVVGPVGIEPTTEGL